MGIKMPKSACIHTYRYESAYAQAYINTHTYAYIHTHIYVLYVHAHTSCSLIIIQLIVSLKIRRIQFSWQRLPGSFPLWRNSFKWKKQTRSYPLGRHSRVDPRVVVPDQSRYQRISGACTFGWCHDYHSSSFWSLILIACLYHDTTGFRVEVEDCDHDVMQ